MYQIIEEKKELLASYRRKNRDIAQWLSKSDLWYWVYSRCKINGTPLGKRDIADISEGKIIENAPVDAYNFIGNSADLIKDMRSFSEMGSNADMKLLLRWLEMLFGKTPEFRTTTSIVYEWELIPVHFQEVRQDLEMLLKKAASLRLEGTPIERAAWLHLEFLKLYPFEEYNSEAALLILMYSFICAGYPVPMLDLGEREYNTLVADYIKNGDITPFKEMLERALINRLEAALAVCYQLPEEENA